MYLSNNEKNLDDPFKKVRYIFLKEINFLRPLLYKIIMIRNWMKLKIE